MRRHLLRWLTVVILSTVFAGCGFQPRGQAAGVAELPGPVAITGIRINSPLFRELRKQLTSAGQSLAENVSESNLILRIRQHQSSSRVLSVDSRNRAVEYELEESARFLLTNTAGEILLPEQSLSVRRIWFRPSETILSADRESQLLRADMRRDLAARMLRRISTTN